MGKIIRDERIEIVIEVNDYSRDGHAYQKAEEICRQIERHVDCKQPTIRTIKDERCEFCSAKWTESNDSYNGGCCDLDEELK